MKDTGKMNSNIRNINYRLYSPCGNITALVTGIEPDPVRRRSVQGYIMNLHREVEQVGFVGRVATYPELQMAGEEFCGNALRSTAWHYLGGQPGELAVFIHGINRLVGAGVGETREAWAEVPLGAGGGIGISAGVDIVGDGVYAVGIEGITHIVLSPEASWPYLRSVLAGGGNKQADACEFADVDTGGLMERARTVLHSVFPDTSGHNAHGVMFTEEARSKTQSVTPSVASNIAPNVTRSVTQNVARSEMQSVSRSETFCMTKIHPCVFAHSAATEYYETACGSGSAAVAIVECLSRRADASLRLLQPSGLAICASAEYSGGRVRRAVISGTVDEIPV